LVMRVAMPGLPPINDVLIAQTIHATLDVLGFQGDRQSLKGIAREH